MKRHNLLPFFIPSIGEEEIQEVICTLRSGWITTGPKSHELEENFTKYISKEAALGTNSCTAALHLALIVLGIKKDDEVITTPFTFCASANVIEQMNAKAVFVDIDKDTLNIDPSKIEEKINSKTKAIIVVHYAGYPCDMDKILKIAKKYNLDIIEDNAHGLGGYYKNKPLGSFGILSAFSFYPTKNITTIEGGMLLGPKKLIDKTRIYSLHGLDRNAWNRYSKDGNSYYDVIYPGLKYNMTDIAACIGLQQFAKLDVLQQRRNYIAKKYLDEFQNLKELTMPYHGNGSIHSWCLFPLRLNLNALMISRDEFIYFLKEQNILTSIHFIPLHLLNYYKSKYGYNNESFPVAYNEYKRILSLPIYPKMSDDDIEYTINVVKKVVLKYKNAKTYPLL